MKGEMTIDIHTRTKLSEESGQTMAEYALVLGLIVLVTVATFTSSQGPPRKQSTASPALLEVI